MLPGNINMLLVAGNMLLQTTCCRQQNCCQFVARLLLDAKDTCCRDTGNMLLATSNMLFDRATLPSFHQPSLISQLLL